MISGQSPRDTAEKRCRRANNDHQRYQISKESLVAEVPMMGILIHSHVEDVFDNEMELERTPSWSTPSHETSRRLPHKPGIGGRFRWS